ncbi:MAG: PfkB family carbohydrate kinase [Candidatus Promineifilaceae bacterium]|nr:PfkB family carbohydrate kinase [Candidatus Promineifilaceae bacterium]
MSSQVPRLVCLGNFTVDDVYLPDGTVAPNCMGGNALYAALGARLWEPRVQIVAPLSPNIPSSTFDAMREVGFDPHTLPLREMPVIHNRVYYDADGGRRWENNTTLEEFRILSPCPEDIPPSYLDAEAFLILAMALEAQEELISWLKEHTKAIVALDTQEDYVAGNEERIRRLISQVDICLPSTIEVTNLLGHADLPEAAQEIAEFGPPLVVIKNGKDGALIYDCGSDSWFIQPAQPGQVVDTTGAGDSFCGGFMAAYLQNGNDLRRAALAGSISASYAVASFGMKALLGARSEDADQILQQKYSLDESAKHSRSR